MDDANVIDPGGWMPTNIVALGYIDGPTEGILRMKDGRIFVFKMVAFDLERELRVITLASLGSDRFIELVDLLTTFVGTPRWPVWVPLWKFEDPGEQHRAEARVDAIISEAHLVAAAVCDDSLERCVAFRNLKEGEDTSAVRSWFDSISGSATLT